MTDIFVSYENNLGLRNGQYLPTGCLTTMFLGIEPCKINTVMLILGTSTKCCIDTGVSPLYGHIVTRNMYRKEIHILRKIVHQVGFIYNCEVKSANASFKTKSG